MTIRNLDAEPASPFSTPIEEWLHGAAKEADSELHHHEKELGQAKAQQEMSMRRQRAVHAALQAYQEVLAAPASQTVDQYLTPADAINRTVSYAVREYGDKR